jgi:hypothetical protein
MRRRESRRAIFIAIPDYLSSESISNLQALSLSMACNGISTTIFRISTFATFRMVATMVQLCSLLQHQL